MFVYYAPVRKLKAILFAHWCACCIFTTPSIAAVNHVEAETYVTARFNVDSGLPQNSVKDMIETQDGYLWAGTQEGLARFDGLRFTVYTTRNTPGLVSNNIHQLLEDGHGNLWILANTGLTRYRAGVFADMSAHIEQHGDCMRYIWIGQDGRLYAVSDSRLFRSDGDQLSCLGFTAPEIAGGPMYLAVQPDGTVWLSGRGRHLVGFRNGKKITHVVDPGGVGQIGGLAVDRQGQLWIAGPGLWRLQGSNLVGIPLRLSRAQARDPLPAAGFNALSFDGGTLRFWANGRLYSVRRGEAVARREAKLDAAPYWSAVDQDGDQFTLIRNTKQDRLWWWRDGQSHEITVPGRIAADWTLAVKRGREGNLWIGTFDGLLSVRAGRCHTYSTPDGIPDGEVQSICPRQAGGVWTIPSDGRLGWLDGSRFIPIGNKNLEHLDASAMAEDRTGALWISTYSSRLWRYVNGACIDLLPVVEPARPLSPITALARDGGDGIWCATASEVIHWAGGKVVDRYAVAANSGVRPPYTVIRQTADGRVWIGGEIGFACLDVRRAHAPLQRVDHGYIHYFGVSAGIPGVPVIDISEDVDHELWLGFWGGGIARVRNGKIACASVRDGLYADSIHSIVDGGGGELWIGSSNGIFSVDKLALDRYLDAVPKRPSVSFICRSYGTADGATAGQCAAGRQPLAFRDVCGNIWFAGTHGIVRISRQDPAFRRTNAFPVTIEQATIDHRAYSVSHPAVAPPGLGELEIQYTAITFRDAGHVHFSYRLEGFDHYWIDAGARRTAYYTNLPPGRYRFRVIACDAFDDWNRVGAVLDITVRPHFYQTAWFRTLSILALFGAIAGIAFGRIRSLKQINYMLEGMVKKRTQELQTAYNELEESREVVMVQNEELQSQQAEIEAQNQELGESRELLAQQNELLQGLATTDGLTGLKNHRAFQEALDNEFRASTRQQQPLSLVLLDVDKFKSYNDSYGHPAGDEVLRRVARILGEAARSTDFVARYGGEEFVIVLRQTDEAGALDVAERFRAAIEGAEWVERAVTASFGVSTLTVLDTTPAELIAHADEALYASKHGGRNRVTAYAHPSAQSTAA